MNTPYKLITCLLAQSIGVEILEALQKEFGITTANLAHARGGSSNNAYAIHAVEILTVLVEASQADAVFEYLFFALKINEPSHGIMFQEHVARASHYTLPAPEALKA
ncbi:MAG: hypothetical protein KU37_06395 [Sulfuricurvum sp. PC08-66]|nr:MAG: hypothetical protein KU37_06395 [Sulfuricurvum sp. PC08-66]